jgi:hypothetical protein
MSSRWIYALVLACACGAATLAHASPDLADKFTMGSGGGTDHKPQSKLWFHDGAWWAIVFDGSNQRIWKFENGQFTKQTYADALVDARASARADVLWDGTNLHVLMWHEVLPRYVKYSYDAVTQQYRKLPGFPLDLAITDTECMVLDRDSTGRLWASFEKDHLIQVIWTTTPDHLAWDLTGTVLGTEVSSDDITSTVAFGGDRIGVFWSDQSADAAWEFGFRVHRDVDPPDVWQPLEIVDNGSAVDDHLNVKADAAGRVYVVAKDLYNHVQLYVREPGGGWRRAASNINQGACTRPILQLDTSTDQVRVFYTDWITSPNAIRAASAPLATLVFGTPETYLTPAGLSLNDVTGSKQVLGAGTGIMALANSSSSAYWGFTNLDTDPPVVEAVAPLDDQAGVELQPLIQVRVRDDGMGVRAGSIAMTVDGAPVTPSLAGSAREYLLGYTPAAPLAAGSIHTIAVSVTDFAYPPHAATQSLRFKTLPDPYAGVVRINFQPTSGATPAGYEAEAGTGYTLDRGRGWDKSLTAKRANVHADVRLDTWIERKNSSSKATWSYDCANGSYSISLAAGAPNAAGKQRVEVEGELLFNNQATSAGQFLSVTDFPVVVTDGQLDVKIGGAGGSTYTQICYVTFEYTGPPPPPPPPGEVAAPRQVTALRAARSGNDIVLSWNPVSEDTTGALITVTSYHVYRGANPKFTPDRSGHTNRIGVVAGTTFTALGALQTTTEAYYLVTAERPGGTESRRASNLAYRRRVHVEAPAAGATRSAYIALPWYGNAATAAALVQSMNAGTGATPVKEVARLVRATQTRQAWSHTGAVWAGNDFALLPGEPIEITTVAAFDWDCIGAESETPIYGFDFHGDIGNVNWISLPQNVTYTDARAVVDALNAGTIPGAVTKIGWLDPASGALQIYAWYAAGWRGTNFALQPGHALAILVGDDLPAWTPARFLP